MALSVTSPCPKSGSNSPAVVVPQDGCRPSKTELPDRKIQFSRGLAGLTLGLRQVTEDREKRDSPP